MNCSSEKIGRTEFEMKVYHSKAIATEYTNSLIFPTLIETYFWIFNELINYVIII